MILIDHMLYIIFFNIVKIYQKEQRIIPAILKMIEIIFNSSRYDSLKREDFNLFVLFVKKIWNDFQNILKILSDLLLTKYLIDKNLITH